MPQSDEEIIAAKIASLDENGLRLYRIALAEGYTDQVCPREDCKIAMLAHYHFIRCDPATCSMASHAFLNHKGQPASLLDRQIQHLEQTTI